MALAQLLAHSGHWILWIAYAIPVLVVLVAIGHSILQQRREDGGGEAAPGLDHQDGLEGRRD